MEDNTQGRESIAAKATVQPNHMTSRFKVGDRVQIYKPGQAEHGMQATVFRVITIEEYGGPAYRGPHAYFPDKNGWDDARGFQFGGALPDAMVVSMEKKQ